MNYRLYHPHPNISTESPTPLTPPPHPQKQYKCQCQSNNKTYFSTLFRQELQYQKKNMDSLIARENLLKKELERVSAEKKKMGDKNEELVKINFDINHFTITKSTEANNQDQGIKMHLKKVKYGEPFDLHTNVSNADEGPIPGPSNVAMTDQSDRGNQTLGGLFSEIESLDEVRSEEVDLYNTDRFEEESEYSTESKNNEDTEKVIAMEIIEKTGDSDSDDPEYLGEVTIDKKPNRTVLMNKLAKASFEAGSKRKLPREFTIEEGENGKKYIKMEIPNHPNHTNKLTDPNHYNLLKAGEFNTELKSLCFEFLNTHKDSDNELAKFIARGMIEKWDYIVKEHFCYYYSLSTFGLECKRSNKLTNNSCLPQARKDAFNNRFDYRRGPPIRNKRPEGNLHTCGLHRLISGTTQYHPLTDCTMWEAIKKFYKKDYLKKFAIETPIKIEKEEEL